MSKAPTTEPTIVLVEDDDVDAMAVQRSFRKRVPGLKLVRALDGIDGLDTIRRVHQESNGNYIVILDLNMPRMSGIEMLDQLRSDPSLKRTVAFVLTTSNDARDLQAAYDKHVAGYVVKAVDGVATRDIARLVQEYVQMVELPPAMA